MEAGCQVAPYDGWGTVDQGYEAVTTVTTRSYFCSSLCGPDRVVGDGWVVSGVPRVRTRVEIRRLVMTPAWSDEGTDMGKKVFSITLK